MEGPQATGPLAELAYRRAREALERAMAEARAIRLQAITDARTTRERELAALMESMRSLRQSAVAQIEALLQAAEIEAAAPFATLDPSRDALTSPEYRWCV
mgnify:CR=1 FL=1